MTTNQRIHEARGLTWNTEKDRYLNLDYENNLRLGMQAAKDIFPALKEVTFSYKDDKIVCFIYYLRAMYYSGSIEVAGEGETEEKALADAIDSYLVKVENEAR